MQKIGIITDTNSGMTLEEARQNDIHLLSMPFFVDGKEYFEDVDMNQAQFFEHMAAGANVATSQPSPASVIGVWEKALNTYDQIIYIPMSSALSSSCQSAKLFAEDFGGRVFVVDNRRISVSQKQSAIDAVYWRNLGCPAEEIVDRLMKTALEASIYLTVDDLKYLKRGGRITPSVAAIGTVLNIKPVLQIQGGKLDTYKKVRGLQAAKHCMIDAIRNDLEQRFQNTPVIMRTAFAGDPQMGHEWNDYVRAKFPEWNVTGDPLPISISCHVGPGTVAIALIRKVD